MLDEAIVVSEVCPALPATVARADPGVRLASASMS